VLPHSPIYLYYLSIPQLFGNNFIKPFFLESADPEVSRKGYTCP